ncbi:Serine/arginine-rich-splicing factor 7 [Apodemus speciosus]|uniref:Serine/arginine-rich-splicing factor 7 n=1 Tax=Apodemus speciosus TaxID=105296 RepID=A0ABQ0FQ31_APOSI
MEEETKVYVGNLGTGAGKGELERAFSYYGPLRTVWIARNPPGFAFVEFEDPRDAEDAVRGLDGKVICGSRVRVELSTGMPRRSRFDRPPARRPFDPNDRCYECGEKGHYAYDCHRYSRRRRSRGHDLDHIPDPGEGDTLAHAAGAVEGGQDQHLLDDQDPAQGRDQDPGLFLGQEAADQNPDLHLLKEVVPHQEVHTEVQVQKEWTEVFKFTR